MSKLPYKIQVVEDELINLSTFKTFEQAQKVILTLIKLLDDSTDIDDINQFKLFNDSNGKIKANANWFYEDPVLADRKATYIIKGENNLNIDFKLYGLVKSSKQRVSWITGITSNFEDEVKEITGRYNVGIDFVIPKSYDRIIIVLTNNYVIRTLELKEKLSVTFQEILSKWSEINDFSNKTAIHTALWESFDLQPLNKKFYAGISERFITLRQHLLKENIFDEKHSSMFANRLIGRIIFTWFIDKKGIINPDLKYFDSKSFEDDSEYYRTKLERLFFGVLNTPTDEREYKDDITPFLNGGLFEARQNDLYKNSKLTFPKNYFDDLFKFLSEYNFTTDESTSQFQQVAIDPEMLGRIFENLLAEITEETGEQARKAKGAFYTPREIVDYMCKESLREYLKTKLPEDTYRDQRLFQLIDAPEKDFQDQDHNWRRDWKPYKDAIITALDDLKILDPACGSGAFPIGMLQLLVRVYERLEPRYDSYKAKLQIIEKNIYGVDIEPMAVEIARLRTWLSIVVDEDSDSKKIKPLPNLEFKFVCANTLIDLDKSGATSFWDDSELENKLQVLRDAYFNTENLNKKKKLRSDYDILVNTGPNMFGESEKSFQLKTYRPFDNESSASFFDPEFMFGISCFNIVFGNPPYVSYYSKQSIKLDKEIEHNLRNNYKFLNSFSSKTRINSVMFFLEKGFSMLDEKGILFYIQDLNLLENTFIPIRKYITDNFSIIEIIKDLTVFENVGSGQIITSFKKEKSVSSAIKIKSGITGEIYQEYKQSEINKDTYEWVQNNYKELCTAIEKNTEQLENFCEVHTGVAVNATETGKKAFLKLEAEQGTYPIMIGSDSIKNKYCDPKTNMFLLYDKDLEKKYNDEFNIRYLEEKGSSQRPFNLRRIDEYNRPKIVLRQSDNKFTATFTEKLMFGNYSLFNIYNKQNDSELLKLILGILNTKLLTWYGLKKDIILVKPGKTPQIRSGQRGPIGLRQLPIALVNNDHNIIISKEIIGLVSEVLDKKKNNIDIDTKDIEIKINELVMDLYNLNDEEKEIIRSS